MDVGNPSNFYRLLALYGNDEKLFRKKVKGFYFDDADTRNAMIKVRDASGYIMDPHGAVGYLGLRNFMKMNPGEYVGIFLETAHPAKFKSVVDETLAIDLPIPERLRAFMKGEKQALAMGNDFGEFKGFLTTDFTDGHR
jgi:threonine synthase